MAEIRPSPGLHIRRYTEKFPFKPIFHTHYIPLAFPFYSFSLLSLPAVLPCRLDFPMQRYSVIRSSSTAPLTGSCICPAAFPNRMTFLSPPCCAVGLGIPFNPRRFPCLSLIFPLSGLHVKSIPTRKPEQLPTKGKKKFNEPIKISDYAKLGKYSVCGRGRRTGN